MGQLPADLRRAFATTVALITTQDGRGPNVMAAEWTFNVSYDPFLIMVVLRPSRATHAAIAETREFGVSLCSEEQAALSHLAGNYTKDETDKLSSGLFETYPATQIRPPLVRGAVMNAECRLVGSFPVGDHTAFVGEVVAATWDPAKHPFVLHRGPRRIGERVRKGESVIVTATPMRASSGSDVRLAGEVASTAPEASAVAIEVRGPDGGAVAQFTAKTDPEGGYAVAWTVPPGAAPGTYSVIASVGIVAGQARLVID